MIHRGWDFSKTSPYICNYAQQYTNIASAEMVVVPKQVLYHIHPLGWENDPEEERFPISCIDFDVPHNYHIYGLYIRLDDAAKGRAVEGLRHALAQTLSQTRHLWWYNRKGYPGCLRVLIRAEKGKHGRATCSVARLAPRSRQVPVPG